MSADLDTIVQVRAALQSPDAKLALVQTFTHGRGVQVYVKARKVGPIMFPCEGETLADVLAMLGTMAEEGQ